MNLVVLNLSYQTRMLSGLFVLPKKEAGIGLGKISLSPIFVRKYILELDDLSGIEELDIDSNGFQKLHHVKEKWTKYFVTASEMEIIQSVREDPRFSRFAEYGVINVGITTGNNAYFSVTEETASAYDLFDVTLPLVGRSSHAHGIYFTDTDWEENKRAGKRARLVCFPEKPISEYSEGQKRYIKFGEQTGENEGYKCSIRERWYIVPSVWGFRRNGTPVPL